MIITVKSYASMRTYLAGLPPGGELEMPRGCRVGDVFRKLKVPPDQERIVLVNGRHRSLDDFLSPGDTLIFFPPLGGG
jgi:molybdopterin converting factor small subunit